jgi:hypothetical protein
LAGQYSNLREYTFEPEINPTSRAIAKESTSESVITRLTTKRDKSFLYEQTDKENFHKPSINSTSRVIAEGRDCFRELA